MASDEENNNKTVISSVAPTGVAIGTQIMGTFEIVEHIATGGMGEVYRGFNIHTQESVAIKIVLAALAHDEKIISLFQKEATVLGRLHHDAIVRYQLFTIDPGIQRACLVMEFVEGRAMSDWITDGVMPIEDVSTMITRVASGLEKAHDLGVVHRDLSPDNVIIQDGDIKRTKIIDFGIAKSANFGGGTLLGGQFAGKYNYVSPEQLGRFKGVITGRSDIYSLGLVAAAGCRGEPLDMGDNPAEAVERRLQLPDLSGVHDELRPLLEMMLAPNPDDRPESMGQVLEFLKNPSLIPSVGGGAEPVAPVTAPPATSVPPQQTAPPPQQTTGLSQPPQYGFTAPPHGQGTAPPPPSGDNESPFAMAAPVTAQPTGPGTTLPPPGTVAPQAQAAQSSGSKMPLVLGLAALLIGGGGAGAYFTGALDGVIAKEPVVVDPSQAAREAIVVEETLFANFRGIGSLSAADLEAVENMSGLARARLFAAIGLSGDETDLATLESAIKSRVDAGIARARADAKAIFDRIETSFAENQSFAQADLDAAGALNLDGQAELFALFGLEGSDANLANLDTALKARAQKLADDKARQDEAVAKAAATSAEDVLSEKMKATGKLEDSDLGALSSLSDPALRLLLQSLDVTGEPTVDVLSSALRSKLRSRGIRVPDPVEEQPEGTDPVDPPEVDQPKIAAIDTTVNPNQGEVVTPPKDPDAGLQDPIKKVLAKIQWLRDYSLPSCTFATILSATDKDFSIEGYAKSIDPFWQLLTDFQKEFNSEPEIGVRLIKQEQCQVVNFLRNMAGGDAVQPKLSLDKDILKSGDTIRGTLDQINGREIWLFLVDDSGGVHDVSSRLKVRDDGQATFGLRLRLRDVEKGANIPQMIVAVATDQPLETRNVPPGTISENLMPLVQGEIRRGKLSAAAAVTYFRFDTDE